MNWWWKEFKILTCLLLIISVQLVDRWVNELSMACLPCLYKLIPHNCWSNQYLIKGFTAITCLIITVSIHVPPPTTWIYRSNFSSGISQIRYTSLLYRSLVLMKWNLKFGDKTKRHIYWNLAGCHPMLSFRRNYISNGINIYLVHFKIRLWVMTNLKHHLRQANHDCRLIHKQVMIF